MIAFKKRCVPALWAASTGFTNTIIHVDGITLSLVVGHRPRQLQTDPDGVHHQEEEDVRGIPRKGFNSR